MVLQFLKSFVSRGGSQVVKEGAIYQVVKTGQNSPAQTTAQKKATELMMSAKQAFESFDEREWKCPCGHVFRASGHWEPTEPARCEAPGCPNPKFYLDGPGRQMLEDGTAKMQVGGEPSKKKDGLGGRFK